MKQIVLPGDVTPFFIVGCGRSGTTLLRLILAGHSKITIPPETWFNLSLVERLPLEVTLTPDQVHEAVEIIVSSHRWSDLEISAEYVRRAASMLDDPRLAKIINIVYAQLLTRAGKTRFGDKTPTYVRILPQLKVLYPDAKFIHLIRDGRDVTVSRIDAQFWERPYHGPRYDWTRAMHHRRSYIQSDLARDILEVRYEDLVADTENVTRGICDFLGEAFERSMLEHQERMNLIPGRELRIHKNLGKAISAEAVGVWKRRLSTLECFLMEACLRRDLASLGYPLRFRSAAWRPLLNATAWAMRMSAPLLDRGIPALRRRGFLSRLRYI